MDVRSDIQVAPSGRIRTEYTHGHQTRQRVLYGRRALAEPSPQHTRRDGGLPDEVHRRLHGQAAVSVLIQ